MSFRGGMSVVELTIVVAILLLVLAISMPALRQNLQRKRAAQCALNLEAIDQVCKKYAEDQGGFPTALAALVPVYLDKLPACPSGGRYSLGSPDGLPPACTIPGHHF